MKRALRGRTPKPSSKHKGGEFSVRIHKEIFDGKAIEHKIDRMDWSTKHIIKRPWRYWKYENESSLKSERPSDFDDLNSGFSSQKKVTRASSVTKVRRRIGSFTHLNDGKEIRAYDGISGELESMTKLERVNRSKRTKKMQFGQSQPRLSESSLDHIWRVV